MRFGKSVAGSFILTVLVVLMVGQGSLWVWFLYSHSRYNARMLEESTRSTGEVLSGFAASAITESNFDGLDRYLDGLAKDENILAVKVKDRSGAVVKEKVVRIE